MGPSALDAWAVNYVQHIADRIVIAAPFPGQVDPSEVASNFRKVFPCIVHTGNKKTLNMIDFDLVFDIALQNARAQNRRSRATGSKSPRVPSPRSPSPPRPQTFHMASQPREMSPPNPVAAGLMGSQPLAGQGFDMSTLREAIASMVAAEMRDNASRAQGSPKNDRRRARRRSLSPQSVDSRESYDSRKRESDRLPRSRLVVPERISGGIELPTEMMLQGQHVRATILSRHGSWRLWAECMARSTGHTSIVKDIVTEIGLLLELAEAFHGSSALPDAWGECAYRLAAALSICIEDRKAWSYARCNLLSSEYHTIPAKQLAKLNQRLKADRLYRETSTSLTSPNDSKPGKGKGNGKGDA